MGRQFYRDPLTWITSDATAVANTTTETILFPDVTIPAYYMHDGRVLHMRAFGKLSTTGTPTIQFGLRWGGVAGVLLAQTEALTNGSGVANVNWSIDLYIQTRSNGATGTIIAFGEVKLHTAVGTVIQNVFGVSGFDAPAVATVDLTTAKGLSLTAIWSAASASNTATGMLQIVESPN